MMDMKMKPLTDEQRKDVDEFFAKQFEQPAACQPVDEATGSMALLNLITERKRQDQKWGEQNHEPMKWLAILGEEYGEACAAILENREMEPWRYRVELVHVAAVAIAAVECFDRRYRSPNTKVRDGAPDAPV